MYHRDVLRGAPSKASGFGVTGALIGWFFFVEFTSGVLQGYYVPLFSDIVVHLGIHDSDINWFEAAQLLVSALVVPIMSKLGDMFGHKRVLLVASILTAAATWWVVFADSFWPFLIAWALQGFYVVWLPLEVALIFDRGRREARGAAATRRAAGVLVVGLYIGAIAGALLGGRFFTAVGNLSLALIIPAIAVTLTVLVVWVFVPDSDPLPGRRLDVWGFVLLGSGLLLITAALTAIRLAGPGSIVVWLLLALGILILAVFTRFELRQPDPAVDMRVLSRPAMWPVMATAVLLGVSINGAQGPLSTYLGTDPALGYGLGLDAAGRSNIVGAYMVLMITGAVLFSATSRRVNPRIVLLTASLLVGTGYALFLPFHDEVWQVLVNIGIAGIGSGALVAALPVAAAAAAPRGQTGIASGLTSTSKTVGGAFASAAFGVVLAAGAGAVASETAASFGGYVAMWTICAGAGFLAALLLAFVPRSAFADPRTDAETSPVG